MRDLELQLGWFQRLGQSRHQALQHILRTLERRRDVIFHEIRVETEDVHVLEEPTHEVEVEEGEQLLVYGQGGEEEGGEGGGARENEAGGGVDAGGWVDGIGGGGAVGAC